MDTTQDIHEGNDNTNSAILRLVECAVRGAIKTNSKPFVKISDEEGFQEIKGIEAHDGILSWIFGYNSIDQIGVCNKVEIFTLDKLEEESSDYLCSDRYETEEDKEKAIAVALFALTEAQNIRVKVFLEEEYDLVEFKAVKFVDGVLNWEYVSGRTELIDMSDNVYIFEFAKQLWKPEDYT